MRKQITSIVLASIMLFTMVPVAPARTNTGSLPVVSSVYLKSGKILPEGFSSQGITDSLKKITGLADAGSGGLYVIQLNGPVRDSWKTDLQNSGAILGDYIPDFAFLAQMGPQAKEAVAQLDFVTSVALYKPDYKLDKGVTPDKNGKSRVKITLFNPNGSNVAKTVRALNGTVLDMQNQAVMAEVPGDKISELANDNNIVYIEKVPQFKIFNEKAASIIGAPVAWNNNLQGQGQVVGIADTGLDTGKNDSSMHKDFQGRIKAIYSVNGSDASDTEGHGTHVAGSVLGNGTMSNGQVRGMAPKAQLVFQAVAIPGGGMNIPADLGELFTQAYNAGARVHSDSWGSSQNVYDYTAQSVDKFMWNNNDMSIVFAAGNDGDRNNDGQPDYNTISSPSTAKNVITVGASENNRPDMGSMSDDINKVAFFSSRGNTSDGRLKPDIVSPGTNVLSTKSSMAQGNGPYNNSYTYMSGTSMATPITAGAVTLLREYYMDKLGVTPKPSLLKATLINGAQDMGYGYPSRDQGWGRTNLTSLFPAAPNSFKFDNESTPLSTGQSKDYTYTVTSSSTPFKASLVWTDYPGSTAASKALVNDLDLTVTAPNGTVYNGNDFSAPYNSSADHLNNVENVLIKSPVPGTYKISVKGYNIPDGPQRYSLVTSGALSNDNPNPNPNPNPGPNPNPNPNPNPGQTVDITHTGYVNSSYSPTYKLYYIDVTQPGTVKLNLKWWNDSDLDLYLFDPAWNQVRRSAGKDNPEALTFYATKTGRYCIKVNAYSGGAAYTLSINQPLSPDKTAVVSQKSHVDAVTDKNRFYDIPVGSAGTVNTVISFDNSNQTDLDIYLYDANWNLISKETSGWYRDPETISYPVENPGTYHLQVKAYKGASDLNLQAVYPK